MATRPCWDTTDADSPPRQVLDRIAARRTMPVIAALQAGGALRFSELQRRIGGVSAKALTDTLRALERDGIVGREAVRPNDVRYALTPLGHSLARAVRRLRDWAYANMDAINAARGAYAPTTTSTSPTSSD